MHIVEAMSTNSSCENVKVDRTQQKRSDKDQSGNCTVNNVHPFFTVPGEIAEATRINVKQH